jgi:serine/threonine protein kinase/Tfp pilus assembly protein PilF
MTIATGTQLGSYKILSPLGAGGMGEVYLAEDARLDRKIALKLLPAEFTQDEDRVRRFIQEAKAASALNHPNIITIYEIGEVDGAHFIATEFIDGQTLRQVMTSGKLTLHAALDLAIQTASALTAAHEAGIIHRDIKPENVMVRRDGIIKVLDFGLAKLTEKPAAEVDVDAATAANIETDPGTVMGTASYMSPEQARGQRLDARTDTFSLGVVLYEMAAGRAPFAGVNALEVIGAILNQEPQPLKTHAPDLPDELSRIIGKALRKDRGERYQHIKDLLLDLTDLRRELEFEERLKVRQMPPGMEGRAVKSDEPAATSPVTVLTTEAASPHLTTSSSKIILGEIKRHKLGVALALLLLLLAVGGSIAFFGRSQSGPIESLAVLPFQNRSAAVDSEYLSDGLAESLIYRLSQLPDLKVSPTSSVLRYKGKETDLQEIGNELGVEAVMSGRILQRGEHLTISVELVDVRSNKLLWGEQYERKLADLLATQREIASEITQNLKLKLSGEGEKGLNKRYTDNNEAYQLYLKGRFYFAKRTKDNMERGIEYFRQAIKLDPNFALAYVGIADTYNIMPGNAYLAPKEAIPQAKAAAQQALAIDPTLAEAHAALAYSLATFDWNWAEAEREFKRAIELNPNVANSHYYYGMAYLQRVGRTQEAIAEIKRALELEPLALAISANLAGSYMYARQNDLALEQARKTYDLDQNFLGGRVWLMHVYNANGMYAEVIALGEKSLLTDPTSQLYLTNTGYAYAKAGRRREAEEIIKRINDIAKTRYVTHHRLATIYVALGERDQAFAELEKAYAERDFDLSRLKVDPLFDGLRDDPRFADLVKRMGLPQ